jgi:hypothetical protein
VKLGRTSWLVLAIGIVLIVFISLGILRFRQVDEQNQLIRDLAFAQERLSAAQFTEFSSQQEELEEQLNEITSEMEDTKGDLAQPTVSIVTSDTLFDIAKACSVEIIKVGSSDLKPEDREGITCSVMTFTVTVEGEVYNLINFITSLNEDFRSGVIKSVSMNIPEDEEAETELEEPAGEEDPLEEEQPEVEQPSADINLLIYTYRGG